MMKWKTGMVTYVTALMAVLVYGQGANEFVLQNGETRVVGFEESIRSVDSDQPRVAKVELREGDRAIRVEAVGPGSATITVVLRSGDQRSVSVRVTDAIEGTIEYLRRELRDVVGLDAIRSTPDRKHITISGIVRAPDDWRAYRSVVDNLPRNMKEHVIERATFVPPIPVDLLQQTLRSVQGLLDAKLIAETHDGLPQVRLTGRSFEPGTKAAASSVIEATLARYGLDKVNVLNAIALDTCDFDVEFIYVEMSDSVAENIGVDLLNGIGLDLGFSVSPTKPVSSIPWEGLINVNLREVLQFLKNNNGTQALTRQSLRVGNGAEANVRFGGEITLRPQPTDGTATTAARTVPYGFRMQVCPNLLSDRKVRLEILDFSATDASVEKSGVSDVEVTGSSGRTTVTITEGMQSKVMAFDRRYTVKARTGVPYLRRIPLINLLFSRKGTQQSILRAGIIAVVRAQTGDARPIFKPLSDDTEMVIAEIRRRLNQERLTRE